MKLFGSQTSPYVRRVRLLLADRPYEFIKVDVFSPEGQKLIDPHTRTRRIPVLVDGDTSIFDSRLICEYILGKKLPLEVQKDMALIDDANDSGITLFQLKKFGLDPEWKNQFAQNQLAIINSALEYFDEKLGKEAPPWELTGIWLYALLDWFDFRSVVPWKQHQNLVTFIANNTQQLMTLATDPRLA